MKISSKFIVTCLGAAAMTVGMAGGADAKMQGQCSNCHTMHNSEGGVAVVAAGAQSHLLNVAGCIGCHDGSTNALQLATGGDGKPQVTDSTNWLAGGYFSTDATSHNVEGISANATNIPIPGGGGVSMTLTCEGCHTAGGHHSNAGGAFTAGATKGGTAAYADGTTVGNSYRFLNGVAGWEDGDWQYTHSSGTGTEDYNVYKAEGRTVATTASTATDTITSLCGSCHGDFHAAVATNQYTGSAWVRHPNDWQIPNSGEYASAVFNPDVPAAFTTPDTVGAAAYNTNTVPTVPGTGVVTCVSCHEAHGSGHNYNLRFDYTTIIAGGGANTNGCFACHTTKDT